MHEWAKGRRIHSESKFRCVLDEMRQPEEEGEFWRHRGRLDRGDNPKPVLKFPLTAAVTYNCFNLLSAFSSAQIIS